MSIRSLPTDPGDNRARRRLEVGRNDCCLLPVPLRANHARSITEHGGNPHEIAIGEMGAIQLERLTLVNICPRRELACRRSECMSLNKRIAEATNAKRNPTDTQRTHVTECSQTTTIEKACELGPRSWVRESEAPYCP